MIVLVSQSLQLSSDDLISVSSLQKLSTMVGVETVILHSFPESDTKLAEYLPNLQGASVYYVNSSPRDKVSLFVLGIGGECIKDDFYLESADTLVELVSSSKGLAVVADPTQGNIEIISGFISKLESGDKITRGYSDLVKHSLRELTDSYHQAAEDKRAIASQAVELIDQTHQIGVDLSDTIAQLKVDLQEITAHVAAQPRPVTPTTPAPARRSGVSIFPPYSYLGSVPMVVLKDVGYNPYVVSFASFLKDYVKEAYHLHPRLIIITDGRPLSKDRFHSVPEYVGPTDSEVVWTSQPTRSVMDTLTTNKKFDTYIVLDVSNTSPKPSVSIKGRELYLVRSRSLAKQFQLDIKKTVAVILDVPGAFGVLKVLDPYPPDIPTRKLVYFQHFRPLFDKVLRYSGIKAR